MKAMNLLLLLLATLGIHWVIGAEQRVVTEEELSSKTGKDGSDIWLSIMGEVYDVTSGKSFYGEGGSYSVFSGRDASVPFITGKFTAEEAKKSINEELSDQQLFSLEGWRKFYADSEKYPLVGVLAGSLYDSDGNPTPELVTVRERIENYEPPNKKKKDTASEL